MHAYPELEPTVRNTGEEIFTLIENEVPSLFNRKHWTGKLMEWAMQDDEVKLQLFRFVDVLPALKSDKLVLQLLNEYFSDVYDTPLIKGIHRISSKGFLPHIAGKLIRSNVKSLARQFIAGRDVQDAFPVLGKLNAQGLAVAVDLLGEEVLTDREAVEYSERYLELLTSLGPKVKQWQPAHILDHDDSGPIPRLDVSLKVSSFDSQLDPIDWEGSVERSLLGLKPVMRAAIDQGVAITFDMEHYHRKDVTIAIVQRVLEEFPDASVTGLALQSYLKDTKDDLLKIIEWAKTNRRRVTVRLTKGAYWDYETVIARQLGWPVPVFLDKAETDLNYEELSKLLLENIEYVRPAFATHNVRSMSHAIAVAKHRGLPKEALEFQVIYGMAEPIRSALQRMGYRVRVYTPIGELIPGMAYLIRRLLENTSNESFLRKSFSENKALDELAKPIVVPRDAPDPGNDPHLFANEPTTDFAQCENRQKMKESIGRIKAHLNEQIPLVIGGNELQTERKIISVNPANPNEIIAQVVSASSHEAERAVQEARSAWQVWREIPAHKRADYLLKAADLMKADRFDLAALEICEVGKTWKEADADVVEAIDFLEYYARRMVELAVPRLLGNLPGEQNVCTYEPKGVALVISPWNFPLAIPTGMVSAALVAGNSVIFKPSSLSPTIGWRLFEIFRRIDLPAGVFQFLPGPGDEVGEFLASHRDIDIIAFTGSRDVGLELIKLAGETRKGQRNVKRVIAEMGGKNAIIIDETADFDAAVKGVVVSALGFQGQKCSACSRVIIVGDGFHEFANRLREAMESVKIGPPEDPGSFMGPVIDEAAVNKIRHYAEIGSTEGKILLSRNVEHEGTFVGPVIISEAAVDAAVSQEEIFGPVVSLMHVQDFDEALRVANATEYALTGGLYSRSPANIRKAEAEFRVGNLYINRHITGALVGRQPFGGFGMSGVGSKAGGPDYLLQFVNPKCTSENTLRRGFAPTVKATSEKEMRA